MYDNIIYEVKDGIGYLTINRPKALNALSSATLADLKACLDNEIETNDEVNVIIVTGADRAFVAGADIAEMQKMTTMEGHAYALAGQVVFNQIYNSDKIFIAAVNGFALGGGCELSMACDIRIASEKAVFGQPEVALGVTPGYGGTQRLPRLTNPGMAKLLILTGDNIKADEAYRIGLVQKVVAPEELIPEAEKIAKKIASKAPIAVAMSKKAINRGLDADLTTACALEAEVFTTCFASEDKQEGMSAFVEKRAPEFKNK